MDIEDAMNILTKLTQRLAQIFILRISWVASNVVNEVTTVGNKGKDIVVHEGTPIAFALQTGTYPECTYFD
jgi:hypothetical protein